MASLFLEGVSQILSRVATAAQKGDSAKALNCGTCENRRNDWDIRFPPRRFGGMRKRRILLTFDDGPHPVNTPKVLDELKRADIQATFFVLGNKLETPLGQELIGRAAAEGHQIGNHTYSHPRLTDLSEDQIREEILRTDELIGDVDKGVKILRPPYGALNPLVSQVAQELGYKLVLWNVDSGDWNPIYQSSWVDYAMKQIASKRHNVVLAHDNQDTTVTKVGALIARIRKLSDSRFIPYSEAFPRNQSSFNLSELRALLPFRWRDLNQALRIHF
jgi:peptidoglycan/xylan/chitin deacetylase (PgdA/CDA1 family)